VKVREKPIPYPADSMTSEDVQKHGSSLSMRENRLSRVNAWIAPISDIEQLAGPDEGKQVA